MEYNSAVVSDKFVKVAKMMDFKIDGLSKEKIVAAVVDEIRKLTKEVGIKVGNLNIGKKDIDNLAQFALTVQRLLNNNPRPVKYEDAKIIYQKVFKKISKGRIL